MVCRCVTMGMPVYAAAVPKDRMLPFVLGTPFDMPGVSATRPDGSAGSPTTCGSANRNGLQTGTALHWLSSSSGCRNGFGLYHGSGRQTAETDTQTDDYISQTARPRSLTRLPFIEHGVRHGVGLGNER